LAQINLVEDSYLSKYLFKDPIEALIMQINNDIKHKNLLNLLEEAENLDVITKK